MIAEFYLLNPYGLEERSLGISTVLQVKTFKHVCQNYLAVFISKRTEEH